MRNGLNSKSAKSRWDSSQPSGVEESSGNVFADLDLPNPELALAKAELVGRVRAVIAERELTQGKAADLLGLDQPKVSALLRGRVEGYSLDRLFRFLNALGQDVQVVVRPAEHGAGRASMRVVTE